MERIIVGKGAYCVETDLGYGVVETHFKSLREALDFAAITEKNFGEVVSFVGHVCRLGKD